MQHTKISKGIILASFINCILQETVLALNPGMNLQHLQ